MSDIFVKIVAHFSAVVAKLTGLYVQTTVGNFLKIVLQVKKQVIIKILGCYESMKLFPLKGCLYDST